MAELLSVQRLEASLDMGPFMEYAHDILAKPLTSASEADTDSEPEIADRIGDKIRIYNFSNVGPNRKWLQDVLLSDTDEDDSDSELALDEDECIKKMLKSHAKEARIRAKYYRDPNNVQYGYYGGGLLSNFDMFPEHQRTVFGLKKPVGSSMGKKMMKEKKASKKALAMPSSLKVKDELDDCDLDFDNNDLDYDYDFDSKPASPKGTGMRRKGRLANKTPEMMAVRRRKVWQLMAKKELGKVQRARGNNHKELVSNCKKVATMCMKVCRNKAMQSQKQMKETQWRVKKLAREMLTYWKKYDRVERETKRRMEKEAEEQRKMDVEMIETKRQQRKLNFLITQTELYAHFMSKKLDNAEDEQQKQKILQQLDEDVPERLANIDDYDSEELKKKAHKNACDAYNTEKARTSQFDMIQVQTMKLDNHVEDLPQPNIFKGVLKGYQLKGMAWLANLYNQGISGILADEMGLGKTVQSIAFLCHIAEQYGVWGPFLVISPASTLHNWQQEMQRFVPDFNVVPYWGSPNERKILRQFWEQKDLHTKDASFHVVITSYQLVVSDYKYFNRIKWQYMVLDEAQAIKSSSSVRWKLLLGFNCRNRLLLSGTPIQNSMAELWALLHFIMPTLFDSHEEFNEWFSKDIESHAENKTGIDERQISRLHMILKPFMLRRIKRDVENELSDKIEVMVYCPLTTRQKLLYMALKKKIRIEELLQLTSGNGGSSSTSSGANANNNNGGVQDGSSVDRSYTSSLMNLVMQFRKVCNHPELFERRDVRSPCGMKPPEYLLPRLIYDEALISSSLPRKDHLIYNKFNIFKADNIHQSLCPKDPSDGLVDYVKKVTLLSTFSFSRFCDLSPGEMEGMKVFGLIYFLNHCRNLKNRMQALHHRRTWFTKDNNSMMKYILLEPTIENKFNRDLVDESSPLKPLLFTSRVSSMYTHTRQSLLPMQETMEHRIIRSKHQNRLDLGDDIIAKKLNSPSSSNSQNPGLVLVPEFIHEFKEGRHYDCVPTEMPNFVYNIAPKVQCPGRRIYCDHRGAQWQAIRHEMCENEDGKQLVYDALAECRPKFGWSHVIIPDKQTLVSDAGKLAVLDGLLTRLKADGHRVLIYSQMTKMIDLLEEYMWHRKHRYMRLDGSSKIAARRDMVADFQNRADIFVFLLSTRAGGLGINLTAADTVIFYDSDWNPTVDQQAMDRAHRLGQTKQVTVYRLICKGSIEERILQRAREKSEIQRMVISGGNFKPDTLKPKEVASLLLDDVELESKSGERKSGPDMASASLGAATKTEKERDRKRKSQAASSASMNKEFDSRVSSTGGSKKHRLATDFIQSDTADEFTCMDSGATSPAQSEHSNSRLTVDVAQDDDSSNEALVVDYDSPGISSAKGNVDKPTAKRGKQPTGTIRGIKKPSKPRAPRRPAAAKTTGVVNDPAAISAIPKPPLNTKMPRASGPKPRAKKGKTNDTPTTIAAQHPIPPALPANNPAPQGLGFYQPMNDDY